METRLVILIVHIIVSNTCAVCLYVLCRYDYEQGQDTEHEAVGSE
jgi:hypothetical protein